jgi:hypothetical protein
MNCARAAPRRAHAASTQAGTSSNAHGMACCLWRAIGLTMRGVWASLTRRHLQALVAALQRRRVLVLASMHCVRLVRCRQAGPGGTCKACLSSALRTRHSDSIILHEDRARDKRNGSTEQSPRASSSSTAKVHWHNADERTTTNADGSACRCRQQLKVSRKSSHAAWTVKRLQTSSPNVKCDRRTSEVD